LPASCGTSGARRHSNRQAQRRRRRGGNDPYLAPYAPLRGKGSCSGHKPTQERAHHRSRSAKERTLRGLARAKLLAKVSGFRPGTNPSEIQAATKFAMRSAGVCAIVWTVKAPRRQSRVLYVIALCRMSREERTRAYVALGAPPRARPSRRSSVAFSDTSPARSTGASLQCPQASPRLWRLDKLRSIT
jgi:hypothetical protein